MATPPGGFSWRTPQCNRGLVYPGDYCEADGECSTGNINNCNPGGWDIWQVTSADGSFPPLPPAPSPAPPRPLPPPPSPLPPPMVPTAPATNCPYGTIPCANPQVTVCLRPIPASECATASTVSRGFSRQTPNCRSAPLIQVGEYCEADSECGTGDINNCNPGGWDIWQVAASLTPIPPRLLSPPPPSPSPQPPSPSPPSPSPLPPYVRPITAICRNTCRYASDNDCDDGGPGAEFTICSFGTDCRDCGARNPGGTIDLPPPPSPSPPPPSFSPPSPSPPPPTASSCGNTCNFADDDDCDDGGPGAEFGICALGTDCTDCGTRTTPRPRSILSSSAQDLGVLVEGGDAEPQVESGDVASILMGSAWNKAVESQLQSAPSLAAAETPNQSGVFAATPIACNDYGNASFDDTCDQIQQNSIICGTNKTEMRNGIERPSRPYRRGSRECAKGCVCSPSIETVYATCPGVFQYVGQCSSVYAVETTTAAEALTGKRFTWTESTFGEQVIRGDAEVKTNQIIDTRFVNGAAGDWLVSSKRYRLDGVDEHCVDDDSTFTMSLISKFRYYGGEYQVIHVNANGYLCFEEKATLAPVSSGNVDDHFSASKGPCFSFLFADLLPESVHSANTRMEQPDGSYSPFATYLTIEQAPLKGLPGSKNTVQLELNYQFNSISVTYGAVSSAIKAVIGPSAGQGTPLAFAPRTLV